MDASKAIARVSKAVCSGVRRLEDSLSQGNCRGSKAISSGVRRLKDC